MVKGVVFDLWNTLAYNPNVKGTHPMVEIARRLGVHKREDWIGLLERGYMVEEFPSQREAFIGLCKHLDIEPEEGLIRDLLKIFDIRAIGFGLFPDVEPVLERLKKRYKLGLISNTQRFTIEPFLKAGYDRYFDVLAFSYKTGILKPDPRVFRLAAEQMGLKPGQVMMVGDSLKDDVLAARKAGMQAVLIKRQFKFIPSWKRRETYKDTIRDLWGLQKYLEF